VTGQPTSVGVILAFLAFSAPVSVLAAPSDAAAPASATDTHEYKAEKAIVEPPGHHFEVDLLLAASWFPKELAVEAGVVSNRVFGFGGALSLAYRGPFFLYPFIDVAYFNLAASTIHPITRLGVASGTVEDTLAVWTFSAGPAVDIGCVRLRLSVGISDLLQSAKGPTFDDQLHTIGFVNTLTVNVAVLRKETLRLNVEARGAHMVYSGSSFFVLGLSGAWDFANW
jgi:hypothetical protein